MSKRWIAWTLVCTLLLGCLGGLSVAAADDESATLTLPTPSWQQSATVNSDNITLSGEDNGFGYTVNDMEIFSPTVSGGETVTLTVTLDYEWTQEGTEDKTWCEFKTINASGAQETENCTQGGLANKYYFVKGRRSTRTLTWENRSLSGSGDVWTMKINAGGGAKNTFVIYGIRFVVTKADGTAVAATWGSTGSTLTEVDESTVERPLEARRPQPAHGMNLTAW